MSANHAPPTLQELDARLKAARDRQAAEDPRREAPGPAGPSGMGLAFKITGDRATFFTTDGQHQFTGLENLNLARIVRTINDRPDAVEWSVSGTISEYRGSNYLLVTRATLKSKTPGRGARLRGSIERRK